MKNYDLPRTEIENEGLKASRLPSVMASYLMEFPIAFGTKKQEENQENATKTRKQQQPFCNFQVFFIFDTFTEPF